jgi:hypothetical protein
MMIPSFIDMETDSRPEQKALMTIQQRGLSIRYLNRISTVGLGK